MLIYATIMKCILYFFSILLGAVSAEKFHACHSEIYCQGPLLDAVQRHSVFPDSKTYVDMPMKFDPDVVVQNFRDLQTQGDITTAKLETFLKENFEEAGKELNQWDPDDWVENPKLVDRIRDPRYQEFARGLNDLWKVLGRKVKDTVNQHPDRHSLLYVPYPFIVPGDRFREYYYWDTYWIIKGLLLSDMVTTAKHMIENFLHLVENIGHIPNGGRVYYTMRSQPPLVIPMVDAYHSATSDMAFLRNSFPLLEKEYAFWINNRTTEFEVGGKTFTLARYYVNLGYPRPEGYREDLAVAEKLPAESRPQVHTNLATAAESGWDFSTRWFSWDGPDKYNLSSIKTTDIIPVDLNTFLCWNELLLAKFARLLGDEPSAVIYQDKAELRWTQMNELMWNANDGVWYDLDLSTKQQRRNFFPAVIYPLLLQSKGDVTVNNTVVEKILDYLDVEGVLEYPGGIPTSKDNSGQQWDFPNAWPPLISLMVDALASCDSEEAKNISVKIASTWLENNYLTWIRFDHMYEKYNVLKKGEPGGGGEYDVQLGFGWSNGVVLELLDKYGDILAFDDTSSAQQGTATMISIILFCVIFCLQCSL